jgi:succinate-semialdehyde dehydrogenase/glutarate-semialdehyde dehydrogenase
MTPTIAELRIGGKDVPAADGARFDVIDPATGKVIASVADGGVEDARAAVDAATSAAAAWAATAPRDRAEILRAAFELMTRDAEFFRWYAEEAVRLTGSFGTAPSGANRILVTRQPVGVCLLVTPWNFPAAMATRKIGPALAAGCTMILKPASDTPLTALALARTLEEAGLPDGVVNVLPARRSGAVVSAMLNDPRVRKLSFTGSTEVGRILLREAASQVVNTSMELGGNAPFLVFADADPDEAIEGAIIAKMRNGGEACTAANRFYAEWPVAHEFSRRLAERMAALPLGPGIDEATRVGPLINAEAVDKVDALVTDALRRGARCLTGATRPERDGYFYTPTVLADVPADSMILGEEIFGPVAPIVCFDDEVGMVGLNRGVVSDPAAPFGGVKQSGIGREGGYEGVLDYTEPKYIAVQW